MSALENGAYELDSNLGDGTLTINGTPSDNSYNGFNEQDVGFINELEHGHQQSQEHACSYCGIDDVHSVAKCEDCNRWFCNLSTVGNTSHIVMHLTLARHNSVSLHKDSDFGDSTLECYNCNRKNVFNLGYVNAKENAVVVILCRLPCSQIKDSNWDSENWSPLIQDRQFLDWIIQIPEEQYLNSRPITQEHIRKLESQWRQKKNVTSDEIAEQEQDEEEEEILPILMRYTDAFQYQRVFAPLVNLESECDKAIRESQAMEQIVVRWSVGIQNKHMVSFALPSYEYSNVRVAVGDEIILRFHGLAYAGWQCTGYVTKLPSALQEEFTLELTQVGENPPVDMTVGFTVEFVWKGITYERMQHALRSFAVNEESVSSYIYHKILGHEVKPVEFAVKIPSKLSIPGLGDLNESQANAVQAVLKRPLSLIQGPPGTGKTVTSATIIAHLSNLNKNQKILVCAPSNVAVDHLAAKLLSIGLKVIRICAKSREDVDPAVEKSTLHGLVKRSKNTTLKRLIDLKNSHGELKAKDAKVYSKLLKEEEKAILDKATIVCATCAGAGDSRLKGYKFRSVLIDEITQSCEPELLIPIVRGSKQVILVGDHQQLGPVVLDNKARDSGLQQSLFERLITLGHVPIRLEVQYRMSPCLSEFPSNMFYEGSLQDGVSFEDRKLKNSNFPWPVKDYPMMFWANYGKEEISSSGTSFLNRVETMNVEKVVTRLFSNGIKGSQIGIITPYEGQRNFVLQYLSLNGSNVAKRDEYASVEVASVDAFQGREKDIIILSCTRANESKAIGFLRDPRRLNVAITRAKYGLVILGNPKTLSKSLVWNHLLRHYREKGCLVEGPLESLEMYMDDLDPMYKTPKDPLAAGVSGSDSGMASEHTSNINSNFFSRLSELDEEFTKTKKASNFDEDDIKSITSSFAAGFSI